MSRSPVTGDDIDQAVRLALATLRQAPADAWDRKAGALDWDCWSTAEHVSDDLFSYAAQLGPRTPPVTREIPFVWDARTPGGPANVIHADRSAGPAGLLELFDACGGLLAAIVRTRPPLTRSYHVFGVSDPSGFAAMGLVEILVHMHDLAGGLGLSWEPPGDLCARALARLFPDSPTDTPPWATLLWSTGRGTLPGRPRRTSWRWDGTPRP